MENFSMEEVIEHGCNIEDILYVNWGLLGQCNYDCSYCFGHTTLKDNNYSTFEEIKHAFNEILLLDKNRYIITISGGEPTLHPSFLDFIEYISKIDKDIYVTVTSNGSKSISFFDSYFRALNGCRKIFLSISIHLEYAKLEHIEALIIKSNEYKSPIIFSLMVNPLLMEKAREFFLKLSDLRENYIFDLYLSELREGEYYETVDSRYSDEDFNWIDESRLRFSMVSNYLKKDFESINRYVLGSYTILKNKDVVKGIAVDHYKAMRDKRKSFKDFYCCGGINSISIWPDGKLLGGHCSNFSFVCNIYKEKIDLIKLTNYVKCRYEQCGCEANDVIRKFRHMEKAFRYVNNYRAKMSWYITGYLYDKILYLDKEIDKADKKEKVIEYRLDRLKYRSNKIIDTIAWLIPVKKWRNNFRNIFIDTTD